MGTWNWAHCARRYDEKVFVRVNPIATGESTKLQPKYQGPTIVTRVYPSDTYEIERLSRARKSRRRTTAHVSQLRIRQGRDVATGEVELEEEVSNDEDDDNESKVNSNIAESEVIERDEEPSVEEATFSSQPKRVIRKPMRFDDYVSE